jgi:hypothetical protein
MNTQKFWKYCTHWFEDSKKMAKIIFTLDFTFYPVWLCDEGNMYIKGSNIRH